MAEFLLELFSEEIPARMQARAEQDLARLFKAAAEDARLGFDSIQTYSTPRRLVLHVEGLPTRQPDMEEERRGPRAAAPDQAIEGFCRSAGVKRDELEEREEKKGTFLWAMIKQKGQPTSELLDGLINQILNAFPWPKSMRWGGNGNLSWVRPLHPILTIFDDLPLDGCWEVIDPKTGRESVEYSDETSGHRFLAPEPFEVANFADYETKLRAAHVILSAAERQTIILDGAKELAAKRGLEPVYTKRLLEEVAGLVEWPVLLEGEFDPTFLDVPHEVLISEMQQHQKYFPLRSTDKKELVNRFIVVANLPDKTGAIIKGNERVLAARLADAKFFWDQDRKTPLAEYLPKLDGLVFHAKLGTIADKAGRMEKLAYKLAQYIPGCDADLAARAARLAKADLVTGMVGEFPELQGIMGGYYARTSGEDEQVAAAIDRHYSPQGPNDLCPHEPVAVAVALADKIDTLTAMFGIGEKPTGSKDPFALRRAALGVVRLILENEHRIPLQAVFQSHFDRILDLFMDLPPDESLPTEQTLQLYGKDDVVRDSMIFIIDRLKVQLRDSGVRHDHVDAVTARVDEDDLTRLKHRVVALQKFLGTEDGANLLAGYKRAVNIVRIEEKKDKTTYDGDPDMGLVKEKQELALADGLVEARRKIEQALAAEDYEAAMAAVARLRIPIDNFFDHVTVNADDADIRANRLRLLASIRTALDAVADFSKLEG